MPKRKPVPALERLDALAERLGVKQDKAGRKRTFVLPQHERTISYKPNGAGSFLIESDVDGMLDAVTTGGEDRVTRLLIMARDPS